MRAVVVILMSTGLSMLLAACSPGDQGESRGGADAGPTATAPGASGQGEVQRGVPTEPGSTARGAGGGGVSAGDVEPPPSPIIDVRGKVASVDRTAGLIRLTTADNGYSIIEVTPSTEFRRSEGESALLADVAPGAEVVGTGLGQNGRLRSRLVTILTY